MKTVFVAFWATPWFVGRAIRRLTGYTYNHVALSFDSQLQQMYSFARRHINTPLYAGFVRESLMRYQREGISCRLKLCAVPVSDEQADELCAALAEMEQKGSENYIYNTAAAFTTLFGKYAEAPAAETCVGFVSALLRRAEVISYPHRPQIPELERMLQKYVCFEGKSTDYSVAREWFGDAYPERFRFGRKLRFTCGAQAELVKRMITKKPVL